MRVWDTAAGKELRTLDARRRSDRRWRYPDIRVCVSGDGRLLAAWSPERLTLWNLRDGKEIRSLERKIEE